MAKKRAPKKPSTASRIAAIEQLPTVVRDDYGKLDEVLAVLRDPSETEKVRLVALRSLQATSFDAKAFASCRADYIAALRAITDEPGVPELRTRAIGILAREKDGLAQRKLLEGLRQPEQAIVPPEKALQLLAYDPHTETYPLARAIVDDPPNAAAKLEALRVLAADTTAAPLFERLLRDKDEMSEVRLASAAALHALRPDKLQAHAREIVLDAREYPEIQATSLTAMTQFGGPADVAADTALIKRVDRLKDSGESNVKRGARRFLDKYNR